MVSTLTQASGREFHSGTVLTKTNVYTEQYMCHYERSQFAHVLPINSIDLIFERDGEVRCSQSSRPSHIIGLLEPVQ